VIQENKNSLHKVIHKGILIISCLLFVYPALSLANDQPHPNVIIIITDDQGYGDLGITGNPHVQTPVIDKFATENIRFNNFYVSPVCAPTRSSLMTGRYSLRTGIRDTYNGGAIMASNEVTIAEMLKQADYSTGIFGKWHLGDNYPTSPNYQGFDESLVHLAGGMGQVGDITNYFKGDSSYFNPILWHNGKKEAYQGYCSDIFTEQAIKFIETHHQVPFFCYLSFNAPHTPLQVPDTYYQLYKDIDPSSGFEQDKRPFVKMSDKDKEDARKVYAMVTNIDDNMGRLLQKLTDLKIADNTLVIFMTDNGPQQKRYIAGMRGRKSSVYRGGVRVPFYLKYPASKYADMDIETVSAHIDIMPTLAEICNVQLPKDKQIDGKSLVSLIKNEKVDWIDSSLFFYWTRRYPELYNNIAIQKGEYKLVGMTDYDAELKDFQLFNILKDPYEQHNIVLENNEIANDLKKELDKTYQQLISSENLVNPPRIVVGSNFENPVILNRNDADGQRGIWAHEEVFGKWNISVEKGLYNFSYKFKKPVETGGRMYLETKGIIHQKKNTKPYTDVIEMNNLLLPEMNCELIPFYSVNGKRIFPFWVEIEKID